MKNAPALAALACTLCALGCDMEFYPETSDYIGQAPAIAEVEVSADAMPDDEDVVTVEIAIADLVLHRAEDDTWVLLSSDAVAADVVTREAGFRPVPLQPAAYDRVAFGIAAVRVGNESGWTEVEVSEVEVELDGEFDINEDVVFGIAFDVERGLTRGAGGNWSFEAHARAVVSGR